MAQSGKCSRECPSGGAPSVRRSIACWGDAPTAATPRPLRVQITMICAFIPKVECRECEQCASERPIAGAIRRMSMVSPPCSRPHRCSGRRGDLCSAEESLGNEIVAATGLVHEVEYIHLPMPRRDRRGLVLEARQTDFAPLGGLPSGQSRYG